MKNQALKSVVEILETPNKYCNFKTCNMGKTWHFILCYSTHTKTNSLATARTQKENLKINIIGLPPAKCFPYSHIARLSIPF
jgi:hypothetical protein